MVHLKVGLFGSLFFACTAALTWPTIAHHWRSSEVGTSYSELQELLAQRKWEAADAETKYLVFQISQRNHQAGIGQEWLTQAGVEQFPCRDLRTIDRLWQQYSNGRYGVGVQLRLWGSSLEAKALQAKPDRWQRFRQHLGWPPRQDPEFRPDIEGRLPEPIQATPDFGNDAMHDTIDTFYGAAWLRRAQQCHLPEAKVSVEALNWQTQTAAAISN